MAYKIRWSPRAASNIEDICNYIARILNTTLRFLQKESIP